MSMEPGAAGCLALEVPAPGSTKIHRAAWWVYAGDERIRHNAIMRGQWGYDVTCSCGWDSRTGGAVRRYVADLLDDHRREARADG